MRKKDSEKLKNKRARESFKKVEYGHRRRIRRTPTIRGSSKFMVVKETTLTDGTKILVTRGEVNEGKKIAYIKHDGKVFNIVIVTPDKPNTGDFEEPVEKPLKNSEGEL